MVAIPRSISELLENELSSKGSAFFIKVFVKAWRFFTTMVELTDKGYYVRTLEAGKCWISQGTCQRSILTLQSLFTILHGKLSFLSHFMKVRTQKDWKLILPKVTDRYPREELVSLLKDLQVRREWTGYPFPGTCTITSGTKKVDGLDILTEIMFLVIFLVV